MVEASTEHTGLESASTPRPETTADVSIIGSGILGMYNALQYAKRGFTVALIDEVTDRLRESYKVGESLLTFSNAFLRTVGEVDDALSKSFEKQGFWMAYGLEGRDSFDESVTEWAFQAKLPERWRVNAVDELMVRTLAGDVQIVRPEIEAAMREKLADHDSITEVTGLVRDVTIGDDGADHVLTWRSRDSSAEGQVRSRWIVDCSGRTRFLARRLGHDLPLHDDFRTAAAWGQFSGCRDEIFDGTWEFAFPDGHLLRRDLTTVHLWGDGYWIWLIRLTGNRISVGVTFDRTGKSGQVNLRDEFWEVIRRYPILHWLLPENQLEFRAYRDVQYLTDTYVSAKRYALAGDAASIIDAFYSQGLSVSMSTSWHTANIVESDLREGRLDTGYIDHVNEATHADWRLMRVAVRHKYSRAIRDSRFFIIDHFIDYLILSGTMLTRYRISKWLAETGGVTAGETPMQRRLRDGLRRRMFLSQSAPWHRMKPGTVASLVERWHCGAARRAIWRLDHGVSAPPMKTALRADAAVPALWRLPFLSRRRRPDLTPPAIVEPKFLRPRGTEYRPPLLAMAGAVVLAANLVVLVYDVVGTGGRWAWYWTTRPLRRLRRRLRRVADPAETESHQQTV